MGRKPEVNPVPSPDEWRLKLASPSHWRTGYSARTLAYCWHAAQGFPPEISLLFKQADFAAFHELNPVQILPEHKTPLDGQGRASQSDVFVFAQNNDGEAVAITVEGKVQESFGTTLGKWKEANGGFGGNKQVRLHYLEQQLGLKDIPDDIYYQLIHRSASAVIEARRFRAKYAVMLVHSFGQQGKWFNEYADFIRLFDKKAQKDVLHYLKLVGNIAFFSAWVTGDTKFIDM
jgi:hypothetical protein